MRSTGNLTLGLALGFFGAWLASLATWLEGREWALLATSVALAVFYVSWEKWRGRKEEDRLMAVVDRRDAQLLNLREVAERVPMKPLGDDGTTYAEVPPGTRLVVTKREGIRLMLPVRISGAGVATFMESAVPHLSVVPPEAESDDDR